MRHRPAREVVIPLILTVTSNRFAYPQPPGFEENSFADLDKFFPKDSRHVVLKGTEVTSLHPTQLSINHRFEGSMTIEFDHCIYCLGATYPEPGRASSIHKKDAIEAQRRIQADLKKAESVLIIGGGPVGVEFSGELRTQYPDKKIVIATSGDVLIPGPWKPSLPQKLNDLLKRENIEIRYNAKADLPEDLPLAKLLPEVKTLNLSDGSTVEADFVLAAMGGKPNTSVVEKSGYKRILDDTGRIQVDPTTLRLIDEEFSRCHALGDCSDSPGPKTYFAATNQTPVVAAQVLSQAQEKGVASKLYKEPISVMVVPFGTKDGYGQITKAVVGPWVVPFAKGKGLFVSDFKKLYRVS